MTPTAHMAWPANGTASATAGGSVEPGDAFELSADPARLDLGVVHAWLAEQTHWARGIARSTVERAFAHSLWIAAYAGRQQVGVARVGDPVLGSADHVVVAVAPGTRGLTPYRVADRGRKFRPYIRLHQQTAKPFAGNPLCRGFAGRGQRAFAEIATSPST